MANKTSSMQSTKEQTNLETAPSKQAEDRVLPEAEFATVETREGRETDNDLLKPSQDQLLSGSLRKPCLPRANSSPSPRPSLSESKCDDDPAIFASEYRSCDDLAIKDCCSCTCFLKCCLSAFLQPLLYCVCIIIPTV